MGLLVALAAWGALSGIFWLATSDTNLVLCRMAAYALALSVGVGIFLTAYFFREALTAHFHYFASVRS